MARLDLSKYKEGLEKALRYTDGSCSYDDVIQMYDADSLKALEFRGSVVLYYIDQLPQFRVLNVFLATGNLEDMAALEKAILEVARIYRCKKVSLTGRRGWARSFLKQEGWAEVPLVTLEREIKDGEEGEDHH